MVYLPQTICMVLDCPQPRVSRFSLRDRYFLEGLCSTMKKEAREVANWDFDKVIPCHGVRLFSTALHTCMLTLP